MSQNNVTQRKPDTHTKTDKASVQTYKQPDGSIVVTKGRCGGQGKGKPGGRFAGKETV